MGVGWAGTGGTKGRGILGLGGDPPTSNLDPLIAGAFCSEEPVESEILQITTPGA